MAHSHSFEALVLKTYDVGEADRYCILFTREKGRIAARASGARRLTSRLGGALLPFRRVTVELKEGSGGWIIAGALRGEQENVSDDVSADNLSGDIGVSADALTTFTALEEGIELLLRLVTDEGALTDVFDTTLSFITACREGVRHASLGYSFSLLHQLGLLPGEEELEEFSSLEEHERAYVQSSREGKFLAPHLDCDCGRLLTLRSVLLSEHLGTPLKTTDIAAAMV
ncbi:MAG: hypothetical protein HOO67_07855 [Candidatus Peribacteraceae bacterium]|nr:hypothetical protein [Candidatus Peribacteraceae bacterium]